MDYKYRLNETMGKSWKIKLMINDIFNTARKNHFIVGYESLKYKNFLILVLLNVHYAIVSTQLNLNTKERVLAIKRKIDYNYYRQHSVLIKTATIYNYNFQNYNYKIIFFNKNFFVP